MPLLRRRCCWCCCCCLPSEGEDGEGEEEEELNEEEAEGAEEEAEEEEAELPLLALSTRLAFDNSSSSLQRHPSERSELFGSRRGRGGGDAAAAASESACAMVGLADAGGGLGVPLPVRPRPKKRLGPALVRLALSMLGQGERRDEVARAGHAVVPPAARGVVRREADGLRRGAGGPEERRGAVRCRADDGDGRADVVPELPGMEGRGGEGET